MTKTIGITICVALLVLLTTGCDVGTPDLSLRVVDPSYSVVSNNVLISFRLYNAGSERLQDCKVKWFVDDANYGVTGEIEYDELTPWAPLTGISLGVGQTSSILTASTSSGAYSADSDVEYYGIYEMGWDFDGPD